MKAPSQLVLVLSVLSLGVLLTFTYFNQWGELFSNPDTVLLPYLIFRTLLRMLLAYSLVILFAFPYGIIAGLYRRARFLMLPLLDILQSIPVLGYLPAAILFFVNILPGELGYELASIFLIFTGMAWAVTFSIIGAVRNIPNDIREASNSFGMRGWRYVRHVVLPTIFPAFITGSVLAWGGGWYFLVAAELISYGSVPHALPGIGSYMGNAVFSQGNIASAIFGLILFIAVVYTINQTVWKPLIAYSKRFRIQTMESNAAVKFEPAEGKIIDMFEWLMERKGGIDEFLARAFDRLGAFASTVKLPIRHIPRRRVHVPLPRWEVFSIYTGLFIGIMLLFAFFYASALAQQLRNIVHSISSYPDALNLPAYTFFSFLRILAAYLIALSWTMVAAILVTRSKRLYDLFLPVFDIGQSTPALALFPFIVVIVIQVLGGGTLSIEAASILLLLTGTQWYLLFNIIGAIRHIPGDVLEASRAFGVRGKQFYRDILIPAIIPGILLGSIQAWGGAWNALIVSEYIVFSSNTYSVQGLGAFLTRATLQPNPDPWIITLAVATMTLTVLLMNYLVWRPLFAYAEKYKFEGT
jgi:NitT/TauT family transport system permease protein